MTPRTPKRMDKPLNPGDVRDITWVIKHATTLLYKKIGLFKKKNHLFMLAWLLLIFFPIPRGLF